MYNKVYSTCNTCNILYDTTVGILYDITAGGALQEYYGYTLVTEIECRR